MEIIDIKMGALYVGDAPLSLTTSGVGSCVVVCLYSSLHSKGGLAHIMLPKRAITDLPFDESQYRYADVAIAVMVDQLERLGVMRSQLIAKIAGGANMFPGVQGRSQKVGEKNLESIKGILSELRISIAGEDVGGTHGRSVQFDLQTGIVTIRSTI